MAALARVLLLDNRDSFVWNLAQGLRALGAEVEVVRSDAVDAAAIDARHPDGVVLSPGPGRPEDAGCCVELVTALGGSLPILGVCLGHQAIAVALGCHVVRGEPCHGAASAVHHRGAGLFAGLPTPLDLARYHSLTVRADTVPARVAVDAWTAEGTVMAIRDTAAPTVGLQFHPESFLSPLGTALLERFLGWLA